MKIQTIKTITFISNTEQQKNPHYDKERDENDRLIRNCGTYNTYNKYRTVEISAEHKLQTFLKTLLIENFLSISHVNEDKILLIYKDF